MRDATSVTCQRRWHPPSAVGSAHSANRYVSSCLNRVASYSVHAPGDWWTAAQQHKLLSACAGDWWTAAQQHKLLSACAKWLMDCSAATQSSQSITDTTFPIPTKFYLTSHSNYKCYQTLHILHVQSTIFFKLSAGKFCQKNWRMLLILRRCLMPKSPL